MIKVLAVAVLIAVILVASTSPVLARRAAGGHQMPTGAKPCEEASAEHGAHFEERNKPEKDTCWLEFPTHDE